MATLLSPAHASVHVHASHRLQFSASSDGLLHLLSEECWGRGLLRLAGLLDDLLIERQAELPEPPLDPEMEALLPFWAQGAAAPSWRLSLGTSISWFVLIRQLAELNRHWRTTCLWLRVRWVVLVQLKQLSLALDALTEDQEDRLTRSLRL